MISVGKYHLAAFNGLCLMVGGFLKKFFFSGERWLCELGGILLFGGKLHAYFGEGGCEVEF